MRNRVFPALAIAPAPVVGPVLALAIVLAGCAGSEPVTDAGADAHLDAGGDADLDADLDAGADAGADVGADVAPDVQVSAVDVTAWGPYAVGYKVFATTEAQRADRPTPIAVYYPASGDPAPEDSTVACDFEKSLLPTAFATLDAPAVSKSGGWPVVVFSHGSGASKEMYKYLLEFLASHGYVAVAPDHTGNVGFGQFMPEDMEMTSLRATDMLWVLAWLGSAHGDEAGVLHGLLDMDNVAVAGHSYGGHIVMALGGAQWDWDHIAAQCGLDDPPDPYVCSLPNHKATWTESLPAPQVKAVISLAHDASEVHFGPNCAGAAAIGVPVMYMGGTDDTIADFPTNAQLCFEHGSTPACLVKLSDSGHMDYTDAMAEGSMACDRAHMIVRGMALAFLQRYLGGGAGIGTDLPGVESLMNGESDAVVECR